MKILARLKVLGKIVTIVESQESIEVEVCGINPTNSLEPKKALEEKNSIIKYLEDEGIMEEVLQGNTNFAHPLNDQEE